MHKNKLSLSIHCGGFLIGSEEAVLTVCCCVHAGTCPGEAVRLDSSDVSCDTRAVM